MSIKITSIPHDFNCHESNISSKYMAPPCVKPDMFISADLALNKNPGYLLQMLRGDNSV